MVGVKKDELDKYEEFWDGRELARYFGVLMMTIAGINEKRTKNGQKILLFKKPRPLRHTTWRTTWTINGKEDPHPPPYLTTPAPFLEERWQET
ncbi:hypothetical protein CEXT_158301 [Caerostris extrusa]|uniref:Uncharacterized protein n=1 Tax=Caerostris extrusa TaxID=172846 RepID=A0AAV4PQI2_CAEEX|nr:hypothetical protein CEXT_158301 [Caerostris extrusa]